MAQLDDLNSALDAISSDVGSTLTHVTDLETELQTLQNTTPSEVDLSSALSKVAAIRSRLEGVATAVTSATDTTAGGTTGTTADPSAGTTATDFWADPPPTV